MRRLLLLTLLITFAAVLPAGAQDACTAPDATGEFDLTLASGGLEREYTLYVPDSYDGSEPVPLVLSLHGFLSNRFQQQAWSQWDTLADEENFIAVFPQGTGELTRWNAGRIAFNEGNGADDVAFIRDLIGHISDEWCIDSARVYVTGLSNGGGMSNRLACEASDLFAAVGPVSGAYTEFEGGCNPTRPVPVIGRGREGCRSTQAKARVPRLMPWRSAMPCISARTRAACSSAPVNRRPPASGDQIIGRRPSCWA